MRAEQIGIPMFAAMYRRLVTAGLCTKSDPVLKA
jgi:hypothetical protein